MDANHPVAMFVGSFAMQVTSYFVIVGVVFVLVWKLGARRLRSARIPGKHRLDSAQLRHELKHTLVTFAMGTVSAGAISLLYARGQTRLTYDASTLGWPAIVATFAALIVFNDAWFYGWHRLLHHPRLFKHVHAVHHRSVDVNPFSSYSFHAVEGLLLGAWVVPAVVLVPMYLPMLGALQLVGLANNVMSHLGYELYPRWFVRVAPFRWLASATYHSLHHTAYTGNYALFFRFWDKFFGTEVPRYEELFVRRGTAAADEPSAQRASA